MGPRLRSLASSEFLISSHFYDEQCPVASRDHQFCICAEGALGGTKTTKRGGYSTKELHCLQVNGGGGQRVYWDPQVLW